MVFPKPRLHISYFSSNTGSILPLSFAEQTDNVTASRTLTLDLAASETPGNALVTDAYTLTNSTNTDLPVTLTYPDSLHIVNQDFGFDPDVGIFSAELDLSIPKYTLDVLYPPS